jgi:cytochrome c-type biogenesis protein CcmF
MNPDTGRPVIKAMLNPLVGWIWAGVLLMFVGTLMALVPAQKNGETKTLSPETVSKGGF